MSKRIRVGLGFALTALFLYLAVRNEAWSAVGESLLSANYLYVVPAAMFTLCGYLLRTLRWRKILEPTIKVPFASLFSTLIIGFAANNVLPARVGEFVRAFDLARKEGLSKSLSFATIVLERVFDGWTLIALRVVVILVFPDAGLSREVRIVEIASIAVFLAVSLSLAFLILRETLALRAIAYCLKPLPGALATAIKSIVDRFVLGLHALRDKRRILDILAISILVWACEGSSYYLVIKAFGHLLTGANGANLGGLETLCAAAFLVVFVNLGIMLPSAPGYVGTFQFFAKMALSAFGVVSAVAFSIAVVSHAMQYVLVTALGCVFFLRENVSFAKISGELSDG
ncbi:MAG: lysylphosphatidylglycerol synthase transmembrane domain-containing protein [Dehalococcoidia bacterium]|nr:lysylphosphatidylglycerol synthase transmembrane domain-containing protein [Dehalococcoidia bacterium]